MASNRLVNSVRFNQDHCCFTSAMETGIRVYNVEPLAELAHYDERVVGSVAVCEMEYRTNLFAVVGGGARPKLADHVLHIYDDSDKKFKVEVTFNSTIKAIRRRTERIVIILRTEIHVFSFINAPFEHLFVIHTRDNPRGLCEITTLHDAAEQIILIFPGQKLGSVQIVDLMSMEAGVSSAPNCIDAHRNDLACLAMNKQGTRFATASCKGTLIRVWDSITKNLLVELRRGTDPATIYCMNFSSDSDFLCCSSDKGTVHIFAIKDTNLNKKMTFSNLKILGNYGDSQWALANFTVPPECACICAFGRNRSVYAICVDGTFHKYVFNLDGNCNREAYDIFLDVWSDDDDFGDFGFDF